MNNGHQFTRFDRLIGQDRRQSLTDCVIAIFGLGGVGGAAALALARAGIGHFVLFDHDVVDITNINRQMIANFKTIGRPKTEVTKQMILEINPNAEIQINTIFADDIIINQLDFSRFSYVIDAIDSLKSKLALIEKSTKTGVPIISALGAGNRLDPTALYLTDIYQTSGDPFAKLVRSGCRKMGIEKLSVIASREKPHIIEDGIRTPASSPFVPPAMGFAMASVVIRALLGENL